MRRLELDFYRPAPRSRTAVVALAVFAVAFTADTAFRYHTLRQDIAAKEAHLASRARLRAPHVPPATPMTAEELAFARATLGRLITPWDKLFQTLESAQSERVALLAIEPDAENRTVNISGEARDYLAVLTYVARLNDHGGLGRVHLASHEAKRNDPGRMVAFTVSASWKDEP